MAELYVNKGHDKYSSSYLNDDLFSNLRTNINPSASTESNKSLSDSLGDNAKIKKESSSR